MTAKIFIDGEAGTTGLQIRERLSGRTDLDLLSIPEDKRKDAEARAELLNAADIAILCLPDAAAKESVALIANGTTRVIDASTAHRVADGWVYGFAEMAAGQAKAIAGARFVANPGCWPQGVIAVLRPLIEQGLIPADYPVTVNGISGYSGGGKAMIAEYEAAGEAAPAYMPYALTFAHKHLPEMTRYTGLSAAPLFQPVVGNFAQGMVTSVPVRLDRLGARVRGADLHAALAAHYGAQADGFVEVMDYEHVAKTPALDPQSLNGSNRMRLFVFANDEIGHVALTAVLDNLGKGASGAAVQNLNLMLGADAKTGL